MHKKIIMPHMYCIGVKNRCRKVDRHILDMPQVDLESFNEAEAMEKGIELAKKEMKSLQKAEFFWREAEVNEEAGTLSFNIFGGRQKRTDVTQRISYL